jgi:hypothetical protein
MSAVSLPFADWQFLVVTAIALWAVWIVVRRIAPRKSKETRSKPNPHCDHCATNPASETAARPARATTTPVVSFQDLKDTARRRN